MYIIKGREVGDAEIASVQKAIDRVVAEKRESGTTLSAATIAQMTEALFDARSESAKQIQALLDRVIVSVDSIEFAAPNAVPVAVKLGSAPSANVVVTIASSAPSSLLISGATTKTFTSSNWNTNQTWDIGAGGGSQGSYTLTLTAANTGGYVDVSKTIAVEVT